MAIVTLNDTTLTAIADAIREKTKATDTLKPGEMAAAIQEISVGGDVASIVERTVTEFTNEEITTVGVYAFARCPNLVSVDIPNVTTIGNYAFYDTDTLVTFNAPKVETVGDHAFDNSQGLVSLSFPNLTTIGTYGFETCQKLETFDAPNVTTIGKDAFHYCNKLTSAIFPNVTSLGQAAFYYCQALEEIYFPKVTTIDGYTFGYCKLLAKADFDSLTSITGTSTGAFSGCTNLVALILRSETMCTVASVKALTNTPIASGTGYIYVPAAIIEEYKADSIWSTYANQFRAIEDYPDICEKEEAM